MIRNFIYLDSAKLRSLSSQLFEGLSEQVLLSDREQTKKTEQQKGDLGSGQIMANIFAKERSSTELKFLEDHAYTLFEKKLEEEGKILDISLDISSRDFVDGKFLRISSKMSFNDLSFMSRTLRDFNDFGESFWRVLNEPMMYGEKVLPDAEARKRAAAMGMQFNKKISDSASHLLDFGFQGMLEVNMDLNGQLFSAPLKRDYLREDIEMFIQKYSRVTTQCFFMVGFVTQNGPSSTDSATLSDVKDANGIKEAMRSLALHLRTLEQTFLSPTECEVIVDPIAIYSVL